MYFVSLKLFPYWVSFLVNTFVTDRIRSYLTSSKPRYRASLVAQMVKSLPAMQETQVWPLGWDNPLEKGMGKPLHYSCLENSMHRGAWWATVHGVTKSLTWLNSYHTHKPRYNRNIILNIGNFRPIYINQTNKLKPPSIPDIISVLNISQITSPKIYLGLFSIY